MSPAPDPHPAHDPARNPAHDPARSRFLTLQALRWIGLALVLAGLLALYRKLPLPEAAGTVLVPLGLIIALIVPSLLAKRWKSGRR